MTTVPAILSCQPWALASKAIQMNPREKMNELTK